MRGAHGKVACVRTSALQPWVNDATTTTVGFAPGAQVGHLTQPWEIRVGVEDTQDQIGFLGGGTLGEQEPIPLLPKTLNMDG